MTVRVITDSAATIPADLAEEFGITVVPVRLTLDGETFQDGEVEPEAILAKAESASTAGPTPEAFVTAIEQRQEGDGVLIATVSHQLGSSTLLAARAAAQLVDVPTRVIDTETAAGGQGLVALEAAKVADSGATLDEVEHAARHVVESTEIAATLPDLDYLVRSGHVPEAAAWAARWVGLRPVVSLRRGKVSPLPPSLSRSNSLEKVLGSWRRTKPVSPAELHVAALHSLASEEAEQLLAGVEAEVEPSTAFVGSFGSPMLLHSGPGVVGLSWWWDTRAPGNR